MARSRIAVESYDLNRLRAHGSAEARRAMAERIFTVWQPLFGHLRDKTPDFHQRIHVDDDSAAYKRIWFYRQDARDVGAIIGRIHRHEHDGRPFSRITMNAGLGPSLTGANVAGPPFAKMLVQALVRWPGQPVWMMDTMTSVPAMAAMTKALPELRPSPRAEMSDRDWAHAAHAMSSLRCTPSPGKPRGVVWTGHSVSDHALSGMGLREKHAALDEWFRARVGKDESLLVVCELGAGAVLRRLAAWTMYRIARTLRSRSARPIQSDARAAGGADRLHDRP